MKPPKYASWYCFLMYSRWGRDNASVVLRSTAFKLVLHYACCLKFSSDNKGLVLIKAKDRPKNTSRNLRLVFHSGEKATGMYSHTVCDPEVMFQFTTSASIFNFSLSQNPNKNHIRMLQWQKYKIQLCLNDNTINVLSVSWTLVNLEQIQS